MFHFYHLLHSYYLQKVPVKSSELNQQLPVCVSSSLHLSIYIIFSGALFDFMLCPASWHEEEEARPHHLSVQWTVPSRIIEVCVHGGRISAVHFSEHISITKGHMIVSGHVHLAE